MNLKFSVVYFFSILSIIITSSCFNKKENFILHLKHNATDKEYYFEKSKVFYRGEEVGEVTNEKGQIILELYAKKILYKSDSLFIKKNPLGTVYFDIVNEDNLDGKISRLNSGDTVDVFTQLKSVTLDSKKMKKILQKLDSTFKAIDTILKEK